MRGSWERGLPQTRAWIEAHAAPFRGVWLSGPGPAVPYLLQRETDMDRVFHRNPKNKYPVAVGGPIAKIMDGYAAAFHQANPDVRIRPIYTGSYQDTTIKALTALRGGGNSAPKMAVALAVALESAGALSFAAV